MAGSLSAAFDLFRLAPDFFVKVDCGLCIDCLDKVAASWRTRLIDDYHYYQNKFPHRKIHFVTLTIAPEYYEQFTKSYSHSIKLIRKFFERYRKRYGCSFKHYLTSEYGDKRGRLHFHMISFGMLCDVRELRKLWSYGRVDMSILEGPKGCTYVSGYINKGVRKEGLYFVEKDKKGFRCVSPGLGLAYTQDPVVRCYHVQHNQPVFVRQQTNGCPVALPRYYLHKLFSPIDLARRKDYFVKLSMELPKPPYRANRLQFYSLSSYFKYLHSVGGVPVLSGKQFDQLLQLDFETQKSYFYG